MRSRRELRELQEAYWAARRRGFTNTAASRLVGVHRRQGRRWAEPIEAAGEGIPRARSTSPRYLSLTERERIADGIAQGRSLRAIAAVVGRSASTVSRKVARNRDPATGRCGPFTAAHLPRQDLPARRHRGLRVAPRDMEPVATRLGRSVRHPERRGNRGSSGQGSAYAT